MVKRIITSVIGLVVFFTLLFLPGSVPFNAAVCCVCGVMLYETYKSVKIHPAFWVLGFVNAAAILYFVIFAGESLSMYTAVSVVVYFIAAVFLHGKVDFKNVTLNWLLTYYITYFMSSLIVIRDNYGVFSVLLVFICAWMTDTGAYFAGRFFGKHKLIPHVSPKKTVEGAIGGVIICVLSVILYTNVLGFIETKNLLSTIIFAALISILSQFGDLAASALKRDFGVKDFGNLLPGHGGLMDRFDSVLFTAPMILYLMALIQ